MQRYMSTNFTNFASFTNLLKKIFLDISIEYNISFQFQVAPNRGLMLLTILLNYFSYIFLTVSS